MGDGREGVEVAGGGWGAADEGTELQRGEGRGRTHSSFRASLLTAQDALLCHLALT